MNQMFSLCFFHCKLNLFSNIIIMFLCCRPAPFCCESSPPTVGDTTESMNLLEEMFLPANCRYTLGKITDVSLVFVFCLGGWLVGFFVSVGVLAGVKDLPVF